MKSLMLAGALGLLGVVVGCATSAESVEGSEAAVEEPSSSSSGGPAASGSAPAPSGSTQQPPPADARPKLGTYVLDDTTRAGTLTIESATATELRFSLEVVSADRFGLLESVAAETTDKERGGWLHLSRASDESGCAIGLNLEGPATIKIQQEGGCDFGAGLRAHGLYKLKTAP